MQSEALWLLLRTFVTKFVRAPDNWSVDVIRLPLGISTQSFVLDSGLFDLFEHAPVSKGSLVADVQLDKSSTMLVVKASISGHVELVCDRTSQPFQEPIEVQDRVVWQFGTQEVEHSENLFEVPAGTAFISLAELFYNLIVLSLPMKKLHPDVRDEALASDREGNLLVYSTKSDNDDDDEEQLSANNPFAELLKLKNLN